LDDRLKAWRVEGNVSSPVQATLGRCPLAPMLDVSLVQTTLGRCPLAPLLAVSLVQATLG